jgi:sec-independent protein translocase protein TatC
MNEPGPVAGDPYAEARMTVLEHLSELRRRVTYALIACVIGFAISWIFVEVIFDWLMIPLQKASADAQLAEMHHKDLAEPFFVLLKTAIFAGVFLAAPAILYQIWAFIAPGLYDHEKKMAVPFIVLATLFFVGGASFCFFLVMPYGYEFLLDFSSPVSKPELMMNEYLALTTKLLLGFGFIFEMPVFSMFLSGIGVLTHRHLLKFWRYSVVIAFIIAAMLTPPDVVTQTMMAGPLVFLYFVSVGVAWFFTTRREKREAEQAAS